MKKIYYNILDKIEKNGFVAYIVGGYVRDFIIGKKSKDVDIITNATPKDLLRIFTNVSSIYEKYGSVKLNVNNNIIDITTFRKELAYYNNKPSLIEYTSSLEADLDRRDFTINTLVMNKYEEIIDLKEGKKDIINKVIKPIKDVNILFKEDNTRIIRALRLMSELDFELDQSIINYIIENKTELTKINRTKLKEELDKLFSTRHTTKFLKFIKEYNLESYLGIYYNTFREVNTVIGVWSELNVKNIPFTKREKEQIKDIKSIIRKGYINKFDVYKYGLFISLVSAEILGISKKNINYLYTNLPIKGIIDINITSEEICEYLSIEPSKELGNIIKTLEKEILEGSLINDKEIIKNRLKRRR